MDNTDLEVAQWYVNKANQAGSKGIEFTLNWTSFKNLANAKRCGFTGLPLCKETRTIDRIDNSQGYVKGNVTACHKSFNNLKAVVENPNNPLTLDLVVKGFNRWKKET